MRVIVTGSTGFIGRALLSSLVSSNGYDVIAVSRSICERPNASIRWVITGEIDSHSDWSELLTGGDTIIHTAGRAHVTNELSSNPLSEFRRVIVEGTLNLARQAAAAGVKRFIFVSSIKVNGEWTALDTAFSPTDVPAPVGDYGVAKWEAEQGLTDIARDTGMEVVIARPPLVYGPGVKANFLTMMRCLQRGIPLPLGAIPNLRSFVALDNLVDLLICCIKHPAAANQTLMVSDGEDISTTVLLARLGRALGRPPRLFSVSPSLLLFGARVVGRQTMAQRLCASLRIDIQRTRRLLDWSPPITVDEGLRRAAEGYLRETRV